MVKDSIPSSVNGNKIPNFNSQRERAISLLNQTYVRKHNNTDNIAHDFVNFNDKPDSMYNPYKVKDVKNSSSIISNSNAKKINNNNDISNNPTKINTINNINNINISTTNTFNSFQLSQNNLQITKPPIISSILKEDENNKNSITGNFYNKLNSSLFQGNTLNLINDLNYNSPANTGNAHPTMNNNSGICNNNLPTQNLKPGNISNLNIKSNTPLNPINSNNSIITNPTNFINNIKNINSRKIKANIQNSSSSSILNDQQSHINNNNLNSSNNSNLDSILQNNNLNLNAIITKMSNMKKHLDSYANLCANDNDPEKFKKCIIETNSMVTDLIKNFNNVLDEVRKYSFYLSLIFTKIDKLKASINEIFPHLKNITEKIQYAVQKGDENLISGLGVSLGHAICINELLKLCKFELYNVNKVRDYASKNIVSQDTLKIFTVFLNLGKNQNFINILLTLFKNIKNNPVLAGINDTASEEFNYEEGQKIDENLNTINNINSNLEMNVNYFSSASGIANSKINYNVDDGFSNHTLQENKMEIEDKEVISRPLPEEINEKGDGCPLCKEQNENNTQLMSEDFEINKNKSLCEKNTQILFKEISENNDSQKDNRVDVIQCESNHVGKNSYNQQPSFISLEKMIDNTEMNNAMQIHEPVYIDYENKNTVDVYSPDNLTFQQNSAPMATKLVDGSSSCEVGIQNNLGENLLNSRNENWKIELENFKLLMNSNLFKESIEKRAIDPQICDSGSILNETDENNLAAFLKDKLLLDLLNANQNMNNTLYPNEVKEEIISSNDILNNPEIIHYINYQENVKEILTDKEELVPENRINSHEDNAIVLHNDEIYTNNSAYHNVLNNQDNLSSSLDNINPNPLNKPILSPDKLKSSNIFYTNNNILNNQPLNSSQNPNIKKIDQKENFIHTIRAPDNIYSLESCKYNHSPYHTYDNNCNPIVNSSNNNNNVNNKIFVSKKSDLSCINNNLNQYLNLNLSKLANSNLVPHDLNIFLSNDLQNQINKRESSRFVVLNDDNTFKVVENINNNINKDSNKMLHIKSDDKKKIFYSNDPNDTENVQEHFTVNAQHDNIVNDEPIENNIISKSLYENNTDNSPKLMRNKNKARMNPSIEKK